MENWGVTPPFSPYTAGGDVDAKADKTTNDVDLQRSFSEVPCGWWQNASDKLHEITRIGASCMRSARFPHAGALRARPRAPRARFARSWR